MIRWANLIQADTLHALNDRVMQLALNLKTTQARKLRVDATVVQTNIHHPTDSSLLADGVRVLGRCLQRAKTLLPNLPARAFRVPTPTMRRGVQDIHRHARRQDQAAAEQCQGTYATMIQATEQTLERAQSLIRDLRRLRGKAKHAALSVLKRIIQFVPLVQNVIFQARTRVLEGQQVSASEKLISLFEPHARVVPRHKRAHAVEFGRAIVLGEVEGGLVSQFRMLEAGTTERNTLKPGLEQHRGVFGRAPRVLTADCGLYSQANETVAQTMCVHDVIIPATGRPSPERRALERSRRWREKYRWRAGIEGRIHALRRDHGLARCLNRGEVAGALGGLGGDLLQPVADREGAGGLRFFGGQRKCWVVLPVEH